MMGFDDLLCVFGRLSLYIVRSAARKAGRRTRVASRPCKSSAANLNGQHAAPKLIGSV